MKVLETTLGKAADDIAESGIGAPSIVCIGRVVLMRQCLDWMGQMVGEPVRDTDPLASGPCRTPPDGGARPVVAGLNSGSGKTTITLGLLRALTRGGADLDAAKSGPDYIDAAFLTAASGTAAVNLDSHAMPADQIRRLAATHPRGMLLAEGVMGLFDSTDGGSGSTAFGRSGARLRSCSSSTAAIRPRRRPCLPPASGHSLARQVRLPASF